MRVWRLELSEVIVVTGSGHQLQTFTAQIDCTNNIYHIEI